MSDLQRYEVECDDSCCGMETVEDEFGGLYLVADVDQLVSELQERIIELEAELSLR